MEALFTQWLKRWNMKEMYKHPRYIYEYIFLFLFCRRFSFFTLKSSWFIRYCYYYSSELYKIDIRKSISSELLKLNCLLLKKKKKEWKVAHFCTFLHFKKKYRSSTPKLRECVSHQCDPHNTNHLLSFIPISHYNKQFLSIYFFNCCSRKQEYPLYSSMDNYYIPNYIPYLKKKKKKLFTS